MDGLVLVALATVITPAHSAHRNFEIPTPIINSEKSNVVLQWEGDAETKPVCVLKMLTLFWNQKRSSEITVSQFILWTH